MTTPTPAAVLAAEIRTLAGYCVAVAGTKRQHRALGNLEAAIDRLREMAEGAQGEPAAFAVYWGLGGLRRHSVHFERKTAEDVVSEIKSNPAEIRPLYAAPIASKQEEPDPVTEACRLPTAVRKRIDAAANSMSWVMASSNLGYNVDHFGRALEGLRSLQANDTPAPAAATPDGWVMVPRKLTREMIDAYLAQNGRFHSARSDWDAMLDAAPNPPASTDRAIGAERRVPLTRVEVQLALNGAAIPYWSGWRKVNGHFWEFAAGADVRATVRAIERAHGITTPPSGATSAED